MSRIYSTDANQQEIVDALEHCGIRVFNAAGVGDGFPDLVTGGIDRKTHEPKIILFEVKTPRGRLRPGQRMFLDEWAGLPVYVVKSVDEALQHWGIL